MRISPNTTIDELCHGDDVELSHAWLKKGEQAEEHKYIRREMVNGKWRYWYGTEGTSDTVKNAVVSAVKTTFNNIVDSATKKANDASGGLNALVDKAKAVYNRLYDDPNNIYDVNSSNYEQKLAQIKETKEWKDIVARKDSEYVKRNDDGTTSYLIDDYIVKKKHPVLDIMSDIISGRKVNINEITEESTIAGIKDHAMSSLRLGMMAIGVASTVLTEKFKLQQGSYDDEIAALTSKAESGADYVKSTINSVSKVTPEDVENLATAMRKGALAAEATRTINEGNVVKAARIILEAEEIRSVIGNDAYYQRCVDVMAGMSTEEVEAINILLKQMRKK